MSIDDDSGGFSNGPDSPDGSGARGGPQDSQEGERLREARWRERESRRREKEERRERREAWRRSREARRDAWRRERETRRKERVLHTRISEQLAEDIRRVAEDLRVPVSNLVRNVLEETFGVVEAVTENVGDLVEEILEEADETRERLQRRSRRRAHRDARRRESEAGADEEPSAAGPEPTPPPAFEDVLGWQPLILNRSETCTGCRSALERGDRAFLGLGADGRPGVVLCAPCMREREDAAARTR